MSLPGYFRHLKARDTILVENPRESLPNGPPWVKKNEKEKTEKKKLGGSEAGLTVLREAPDPQIGGFLFCVFLIL